MRTWLVDDRGNIFDSASPQLRSELHAWGAGSEFTDYCICNLGFIAVTRTDRRARVRLRPHVVSPVAFAGLMYWLADQRIEAVMLSHLDQDWTHEVLGGKFRKRLLELMRFGPETRDRDMLRQPTDIAHLNLANPLIALLRLFGDGKSFADRDRRDAILERTVAGRFVTVASADLGLQSMVVEEVGPGHAREANYWMGRHVGHRLEDGPDPVYGRWLAESYRMVLQLGAPMLDDVDVVVDWPQIGRTSYRYQRLLIPSNEGNRRIVLCATLKAPGIDLRSKAV